MPGNPMLSPVYELADGDQDFLNEVLDSMAVAIPDDIHEMEIGMDKGDIESVCRSAHHMKSSIMYSRAEELKEMLTAIETKKNSSSAIPEVKAIMPKLKELANALSSIIESEKKL